MQYDTNSRQALVQDECLLRGIDFWMLNDALDEKQMCFELDQMRSQGVRTVIVRTYTGLKSDYPGSGFKQKFRAALEHAAETGMRFVIQAAYMPEAVPDLAPEHTAGCMIESSPGVYTFKQTPMYIDMLNPEAVKCYLEKSYIQMWQEFSEHFGKTIISVWVDEPSYSRDGIPWSSVLVEEYRKMWGTLPDPAPCFHDMPGCGEARFRYWNTVVRLLEKSYYKQVQHCCHKLGLLASGHLMGEGNFHSNFARGAAMMPFYRYFDIPGIDCLTAEMDFADSPLPRREGTPGVFQELYTTVLQCVSAARQAGSRRVLCEMYGVTSENFALRNQISFFNRFAAMGINCRTVHAMFYSLHGRAKRAYPPHINYYQPYWRDYHISIENTERSSRFVSEGKSTAETMVILPWNTAVTLYARGEMGSDGIEKLRLLERNFLDLERILLHNQIGFDLGDEFLLADEGSVCENKLVCGKCTYSTVILPWCTKLADSTVRLLKEFAANGGKVFALGENILPEAAVLPSSAVLCKELEKLHPADFKSDDRTSLLMHRTKGDDQQERLFVYNCDCRNAHTLELARTAKELKDDGTYGTPGQKFTIQPGGALKLLFTGDAEKTACVPAAPAVTLKMSNLWKLQKLSPNAFVLEFARFRRAGEKNWSQDLPVLAICGILTGEKYSGDIELRFDFECAGEFSGCRLAIEDPETYRITLNGREISGAADGFFCAKEFETVPLPTLNSGVNTLVLARYFSPLERPVKGVTELYEHLKGVELEVPFITGDFAVETLREPTFCPGTIRLNRLMRLVKEQEYTCGSLTENGYPFFAGQVRLTQEFEVPENLFSGSAVLRFGHFHAGSARVFLNGREEGVIHSPPYSTTLANIRQGKNTLVIELAGTLRNLLGPSHRPGGEYGECFGGYGFPNKNWTGEIDNNGRSYPQWYKERTPDTPAWCESFMQVAFGVSDAVIEFELKK